MSKSRDPACQRELLTDDFARIVEDDSICLIAEGHGWDGSGLSYALAALKAGKCYVTANKELVSKHFEELEQAAAEAAQACTLSPAWRARCPSSRR